MVIKPSLAETMKRLVTGRTDEVLNGRFGISYNSWWKLVGDQPVRATLWARLIERVTLLTHSHIGHEVSRSG